jgi:DNA-binding transcriptional MerR regulator
MVEEPLSIGDVINLLRDDFPDVSVSKIRFLEAQGLISPARSTAGYRQFGPLEIQRLRYILGLQRDHFLPLKVI